MSDLVDRRRGYYSEDDDGDDSHHDQVEQLREDLRRLLGLLSGSPLPTDHQAAIAIIDAAVEKVARSVRFWSVRQPDRRLKPRRDPSLAPTESTRYGAQLYPERNLRSYFYAEVLGISCSQIGRRLGISKGAAWLAKRSGAKLAAAFGRDKLDPRTPHDSDRPHGKNEARW